MKLLFCLFLLIASAISSCSADLPKDKIVFSVMGRRGEVEITCSGNRHLRDLGILVEYRKEAQKLFAVAYNGHGDQTSYLALNTDEACSISPTTVGEIGADDLGKYYHAAHKWLSATKRDAPICINQPQGRTCLQGTAVFEFSPNADKALGTQTTFVVFNQDLKVKAAFVVPVGQPQEFSGFSDVIGRS
jgi:hypothetical protein